MYGFPEHVHKQTNWKGLKKQKKTNQYFNWVTVNNYGVRHYLFSHIGKLFTVTHKQSQSRAIYLLNYVAFEAADIWCAVTGGF